MDKASKVVTFVMSDETIVRIDMGVDDNQTIQSLKSEIESGNASYHDGFVNLLLQYITPHTPLKGAEIQLNKVPEGCATLGDIKRKYNLPDGCLRNNVVQGGGNFDTYKAEAPIYIHVETLANGLGLTVEQIQSLFNK